MPYVETATSDFIQFSGQNEVVLYDYNKKDYQKIKLPEDAENQDFCYQNKYVAYTLENNLYIANPDKTEIAITTNKDKNIVSGKPLPEVNWDYQRTFVSRRKQMAFYQKMSSR